MSPEQTWNTIFLCIVSGSCLGSVITATVMAALHRRAIRRAEDASWRAASTYHAHIAAARYTATDARRI